MLEEIPPVLWHEIGSYRIDHFSFSPTRGMVGGIILEWNSVILSGNLVQVGEFSVTVDFCLLER